MSPLSGLSQEKKEKFESHVKKLSEIGSRRVDLREKEN